LTISSPSVSADSNSETDHQLNSVKCISYVLVLGQFKMNL